LGVQFAVHRRISSFNKESESLQLPIHDEFFNSIGEKRSFGPPPVMAGNDPFADLTCEECRMMR